MIQLLFVITVLVFCTSTFSCLSLIVHNPRFNNEGRKLITNNNNNNTNGKKAQTKLASIPTQAIYADPTAQTVPSSNLPKTSSSLSSDTFARTCSHHSIHLISLPPLNPEKSPKLIKDLWKWKDIVLGDGRDYFIPRPRAIKALSDILVGSQVINHVEMRDTSVRDNNADNTSRSVINITSGVRNKDAKGIGITHCIEECALLSNCARFDIILSVRTVVVVVDDDDDNNKNKDTDASYDFVQRDVIKKLANQAAQLLVSNCLLNQISSYQNTRNEKGSTATLWEGISSFLDLPGMVIDERTTVQSETNNSNDYPLSKEKTFYINDIESSSQHLSKLLKSQYQTSDIINHFCLIASGLAKRDSRPDRTVTFRPFSSRDAHIMLQIKRTVDVASIYPRMKIILDTALNAGKSARDVNKVPILKELKGYDCEGKYSTSAPPELANAAIEDVKALAIQPAVENCLKKLKAYDNSKLIASFKQQVDKLLQMDDNEDVLLRDSQFVKQITHDTVMKLRDGEDVDVEHVFQQIVGGSQKLS